MIRTLIIKESEVYNYPESYKYSNGPSTADSRSNVINNEPSDVSYCVFDNEISDDISYSQIDPTEIFTTEEDGDEVFFADLYDQYLRQMEDEEICNRESLPMQLKHCREEKHNRFINEKENTIQNNAQDKPPAAVNNEYPETKHTESCHNGERQSVKIPWQKGTYLIVGDSILA